MAKARVSTPLEGHQVQQVPRHRPVHLAEKQGRSLGHFRRRNSTIDCRFATTYHDDTLPGGNRLIMKLLSMHCDATEMLHAWHLRHQWGAIHARGHNHEIEVLLARLLALFLKSHTPPSLAI